MSLTVPDSRLRDPKGETWWKPPTPDFCTKLEPIFCVNCGEPRGYVTTNIPCVLFLCDECFETYGGLPLPEIPEAYVRGGL